MNYMVIYGKERKYRMYYTLEEVANRLKVTVRTIKNWIKQGKIESVKFGKVVRIHDSEIQRISKGF